MAEDNRQLMKSLGLLSSIGISMVASSFIGLFIGYSLDKWLGTTPWMTLIWLGIGIASGFRNIFILTRRALREQEQDQDQENNGSS
ncbi:MAG: AtpZ/AtpI family protein [Desulfuromonadales bacterium]|jgi:ATP synthase protein I|nr:AtpZ/AtpI family protein [Desulfuromonadales bacterium]